MTNKTVFTIFTTITAIAVICWFGVNYVTERLCDEVPQVSQWEAFCLRGMVALPLLFVLLIAHRRSDAHRVCDALMCCVITVCAIEAVLSLMQLYGFEYSHHSLYKVTGTFYNPGPLGGFVALGVPIAVHFFMIAEEKRKTVAVTGNALIFRQIQRYAIILLIALLLIVLPSTMSRTGWIAAVVGAAYVFACMYDWRRLHLSRRMKMLLPAAVAVVVIVGVIGIWHMKRDSAMGRVFLWRISAEAAMLSPLTGSATFAEAYSEAQEAYFERNMTNGDTSACADYVEVAGCPSYAFNEYLNVAIDWGIPVALAVVALLAVAIVRGHKRKRYGAVGALLSLMVFAFASYPMHLPAFVAVLIVLIVSCLWPSADDSRWWRLPPVALLALVLALAAANYSRYAERHSAMAQWEKAQFFYNSHNYTTALKQYEAISEDMKWNGVFMYEYGHMLHSEKFYEKSNEILKSALHLTTDPMSLNIIGKNHQQMGQYGEAEKYFLRSVHRLPNRMYPHYLLFLLYLEKNFENDVRCAEEADIILNMKVKNESEATQTMQREVEERVKSRE